MAVNTLICSPLNPGLHFHAIHSWKPPILQDAESTQNVMQDHKNLHLAKLAGEGHRIAWHLRVLDGLIFGSILAESDLVFKLYFRLVYLLFNLARWVGSPSPHGLKKNTT